MNAAQFAEIHILYKFRFYHVRVNGPAPYDSLTTISLCVTGCDTVL